MTSALRKRLHKEDEGFTLIELMVVVLIIAILLAIAIPTFLGARARAQHRAAESNLRNALTAEKTVYTDAQAYVDTLTTTGPSVLSTVEPSLSWLASGAVKGTNQINVTTYVNGTANAAATSATNAPNTVCLIGVSADGTTYGIFDVATADTSGTKFGGTGTFYGSTAAGAATPLACPTGTSTAAVTGTGWGISPSLGGW
jgi:type IV pilus assembly protein PilA